MKTVDLKDILREQGITEGVLVLRHTPQEPQLRKVLPWLASDRPRLYNAYQQTQTARVEKQMKKAKYVASFIGHGPGKAVFVGLYKCGKSHRLTRRTYWSVPENRELRKFGARGWRDEDDRPFVLWFDLELDEIRTRRIGRLVVSWPGREINWWKWADEHAFLPLERNHAPSSGPRTPERTPEASDLTEPPRRLEATTYRILRDTKKARRVKLLHDFKCQICGHTIKLADGSYAEAHHIRPLGGDHGGPDVVGNILCVCPNHHAELDLGVSPITISALRASKGHVVAPRYVDYHNQVICGRSGLDPEI